MLQVRQFSLYFDVAALFISCNFAIFSLNECYNIYVRNTTSTSPSPSSLAQAQSAFHPSRVGKWEWGPASAGKEKAGMVHSISKWMYGVQVNCEIPWECVPYLSALEVCSWWDVIQIHVSLTFTLPTQLWP